MYLFSQIEDRFNSRYIIKCYTNDANENIQEDRTGYDRTKLSEKNYSISSYFVIFFKRCIIITYIKRNIILG